MGTHDQSYFSVALWAGLAAPIGLYTTSGHYPYLDGSLSVAQSFAQVGSYMSFALGNVRETDRSAAAPRG